MPTEEKGTIHNWFDIPIGVRDENLLTLAHNLERMLLSNPREQMRLADEFYHEASDGIFSDSYLPLRLLPTADGTFDPHLYLQQRLLANTTVRDRRVPYYYNRNFSDRKSATQRGNVIINYNMPKEEFLSAAIQIYTAPREDRKDKTTEPSLMRAERAIIRFGVFDAIAFEEKPPQDGVYLFLEKDLETNKFHIVNILRATEETMAQQATTDINLVKAFLLTYSTTHIDIYSFISKPNPRDKDFIETNYSEEGLAA